jgi:polar amino acid transport system ATP-binding protein
VARPAGVQFPGIIEGFDMPILRVRDLTKSFGPLTVVKGLSFDVERGQKVAIIGPSGSGKTTALRCLNFLERPESGSVEIDGERFGVRNVGGSERFETDTALAKRRADIGFVFQRFNLFSHLTALENVTLAPRLVRKTPRDAAEDFGRKMLARVGLADKENNYPDALSGGQQQRVAIARVLAMQPKLILFDEPTSALDPELVGEVLAVMRDLASEGMTMLVVTHEIRFAAEVADRILFMDGGSIVSDGPPRQVLYEQPTDRMRQFLRSLSMDVVPPGVAT